LKAWVPTPAQAQGNGDQLVKQEGTGSVTQPDQPPPDSQATDVHAVAAPGRMFTPYQEGCRVCWRLEDVRRMVACDGCGDEYHVSVSFVESKAAGQVQRAAGVGFYMCISTLISQSADWSALCCMYLQVYCATPPLLDVPEGTWYCRACTRCADAQKDTQPSSGQMKEEDSQIEVQEEPDRGQPGVLAPSTPPHTQRAPAAHAATDGADWVEAPVDLPPLVLHPQSAAVGLEGGLDGRPGTHHIKRLLRVAHRLGTTPVRPAHPPGAAAGAENTDQQQQKPGRGSGAKLAAASNHLQAQARQAEAGELPASPPPAAAGGPHWTPRDRLELLHLLVECCADTTAVHNHMERVLDVKKEARKEAALLRAKVGRPCNKHTG
jgi:hypothetical protein